MIINMLVILTFEIVTSVVHVEVGSLVDLDHMAAFLDIVDTAVLVEDMDRLQDAVDIYTVDQDQDQDLLN